MVVKNEKELKELIEQLFNQWVTEQDDFTKRKIKESNFSFEYFKYETENILEKFMSKLEHIDKNEVYSSVSSWAGKAIGDYTEHLTSKSYLGYDVDDI